MSIINTQNEFHYNLDILYFWCYNADELVEINASDTKYLLLVSRKKLGLIFFDAAIHLCNNVKIGLQAFCSVKSCTVERNNG